MCSVCVWCVLKGCWCRKAGVRRGLWWGGRLHLRHFSAQKQRSVTTSSRLLPLAAFAGFQSLFQQAAATLTFFCTRIKMLTSCFSAQNTSYIQFPAESLSNSKVCFMRIICTKLGGSKKKKIEIMRKLIGHKSFIIKTLSEKLRPPLSFEQNVRWKFPALRILQHFVTVFSGAAKNTSTPPWKNSDEKNRNEKISLVSIQSDLLTFNTDNKVKKQTRQNEKTKTLVYTFIQ